MNQRELTLRILTRASYFIKTTKTVLYNDLTIRQCPKFLGNSHQKRYNDPNRVTSLEHIMYCAVREQSLRNSMAKYQPQLVLNTISKQRDTGRIVRITAGIIRFDEKYIVNISAGHKRIYTIRQRKKWKRFETCLAANYFFLP